MKQSFITLDIVKNLRRGRTVIVEFLDSNSWTVTVQRLDSNSWRFKQQQFKYKERNDNYGWSKNNNINGCNEKNIKYKERND